MQITDVETHYLEIPRKRGVKPYTIVKIHTDEGITGFGGQTPGYGIELKQMIDNVVKPYLINEIVEPHFVDKLSRKIRWWEHRIGPRACSVEIALWDLIGKDAKQPIYKILGANKTKVKAYASTIPSIKNSKERAEDAVKWLEYGFKAVKLKIASPSIEKNIGVVKAVQDATGGDMEIICDAIQAWKSEPPYWSRRFALKMAQELEKLEVLWLEEPLFRTDLEGLAELASKVGIPIAGGEIEFGLHYFKELLLRGCYDIVQPCVTWAGGISEVKKIAAFTEAIDKQCIPCCWGPGLTIAADLHIIGSTNCEYVEYGYDPPDYTVDLRDNILEEPILLKDGFVEIPNKPGLGVKLDEENIKRFTIA
jgi:L-alanine-DL-glutamate epimerase-like enolase superfamily enzyme